MVTRYNEVGRDRKKGRRKSVVMSEFMMDQVTKSSCVKVRKRFGKRKNQKHGEKDMERKTWTENQGDRPQNPKWLAM